MSQGAYRLPAAVEKDALEARSVGRNAAAGEAGRRFRVVQIHPSLRLGGSQPGSRRVESLPVSLIERLIVDAAAETYDAVSVSGGEPLLGAGLFDALALAKEFGLTTVLTTSLAPLTVRRLDKLAGVLDAVAITLCGWPPSHDRMRGKGAFAAMAARLPALRAAGVPFGFIFAASQGNLDELPWIARLARDEGARLLQIRPVAAAVPVALMHPGAIAANGAFLASMRVNEPSRDRCSIRLDLSCRDGRSGGGQRAAAEADDDPRATLGELVSPLVVEPDGAVVPLAFGYPRRYGLGNLRCARLPALAARWRGGGHARFCAHRDESGDGAPADRGRSWFAAVAGRLAPPLALAID